jgi:CHAT domain-containing protein
LSPDNPGQGGLIPAYSFWQNKNGRERNAEFWFRPLDDCGKWLGENLLAPLERELVAKQLILVPNGQLGLLPLQSAWLADTSRPTGRRYLTDSFVVRYAPSVRVLLRRDPEIGMDSFFGVADPQSANTLALPYAGAEISIAASTFPEKQVVTGGAVTAAAVKAGLSAAVVHLCCHAFCDFDRPYDSTFALTGNEKLLLQDMVRIDFRQARLVILSACESGKITRRSADQMVSFSSALLGAGTRAVIATSWNIDDPAASLLMLYFYYSWRVRNIAPAVALQEAQQWLRDTTNDEKMRLCEKLLPAFGGTAVFDISAINALYRLLARLAPEERTYEHPHYWAAFTYSGQ